MSRKRNDLEETIFLAEIVETMSDEEAAAAYETRFGKKISVSALRKRRQRAGYKKEGWNKQFKLVKRDEE